MKDNSHWRQINTWQFLGNWEGIIDTITNVATTTDEQHHFKHKSRSNHFEVWICVQPLLSQSQGILEVGVLSIQEIYLSWRRNVKIHSVFHQICVIYCIWKINVIFFAYLHIHQPGPIRIPQCMLVYWWSLYNTSDRI